MIHYLLFFLLPSCDHRDLHSFPTRRSSDLFLYKMGLSGCRWFGGLGDYLSVRKMALVGNEPRTIDPDSRSEEHSLNSSHTVISYAVFCLKKKNQTTPKNRSKHGNKIRC